MSPYPAPITNALARRGHLLSSQPAAALPFVFLGGVLTSLTPCIYTMIPITAAVLRGATAQPARARSGVILRTSACAKAPGAMGETLDGTATDLSQFTGRKPAALEFWATWCPLCRKLEPQIKMLREQYKGRVNFAQSMPGESQ